MLKYLNPRYYISRFICEYHDHWIFPVAETEMQSEMTREVISIRHCLGCGNVLKENAAVVMAVLRRHVDLVKEGKLDLPEGADIDLAVQLLDTFEESSGG